VESASHAANVTAAFRELGVERWTSDHIPEDQRGQIATFVAPPFHAFESAPADAVDRIGPAKTISTHGLRPGDPDDDRFCIFAGRGVARARIARAAPEQYGATLARLLDVSAPELPAEALI